MHLHFSEPLLSSLSGDQPLISPYSTRQVMRIKEIVTKDKILNLDIMSTLWDVKEPTHCSQRVGDVVPGVVDYLCVYTLMVGWVNARRY